MAIGYGTKLATGGLQLHLDAANPKCYPGTGSVVYDLVQVNPTISSIDTPVITEKAFDFTASNTDGLNVSNNNFLMNDFTMETVFSVAGNHYHYDGALISSGNWNNDHWSLSVTQNNLAIRTRNPNITVNYTFTIGNWYHLVYRRNGTNIQFFVNGVSVYSDTHTTHIPLVSDASNTTVGRETYAGGYFNLNGKIAVSKLYNRSLTDTQVQHNFEAYRGRYDI